MFENIAKFFKKFMKAESQETSSKDTAKERLHLVLMQDRANVSADFLEMMKQEIIEVIKKYIDVDENAIDVRLTNKANDDGTNGAPALYANIPIISIKDDKKDEVETIKNEKKEEVKSEDKEEKIEESKKSEKTKKTNKKEESEKEVEPKEKEEDNNVNETNVETAEENTTTENSEENKKEETNA